MYVCSRGHSDHSCNSSTTTEVKPNSSPDISPPSGPVALLAMAAGRASNQPADGDVAVKTEEDQATEGEDEEEYKSIKVLFVNQHDVYHEFIFCFF